MGEGPGKCSGICPHLISHLKILVGAHREKNPSNVKFATLQNSTTWVCVGSLHLIGFVSFSIWRIWGTHEGHLSFLISLLPDPLAYRGISFPHSPDFKEFMEQQKPNMYFSTLFHYVPHQNTFSQHLIRFPGNGKADCFFVDLLSVCEPRTLPIV